MTSMTAIETITVPSGGVSLIEFDVSKLTGYEHLLIRGSLKNSSTGQVSWLTINGTDSIGRTAFGQDSSMYCLAVAYLYCTSSTYGAGNFNNFELWFPNWARTDAVPKEWAAQFYTSGTTGSQSLLGMIGGGYDSTSAVSTIKLTPQSGYAEHSTATIYGLG